MCKWNASDYIVYIGIIITVLRESEKVNIPRSKLLQFCPLKIFLRCCYYAIIITLSLLRIYEILLARLPFVAYVRTLLIFHPLQFESSSIVIMPRKVQLLLRRRASKPKGKKMDSICLLVTYFPGRIKLQKEEGCPCQKRFGFNIAVLSAETIPLFPPI